MMECLRSRIFSVENSANHQATMTKPMATNENRKANAAKGVASWVATEPVAKADAQSTTKVSGKTNDSSIESLRARHSHWFQKSHSRPVIGRRLSHQRAHRKEAKQWTRDKKPNN